VSTKVGNSVVRSKVKRRLRDIFRKQRALMPDSSDLVLIARSSAAKAPYDKLLRDFGAVAAQAAKAKGPGAAAAGAGSEEGGA